MGNLKEDTKKAFAFVEHIKEHLRNMPEVKDKRPYCKICNKDIDTIWEEYSKIG